MAAVSQTVAASELPAISLDESAATSPVAAPTLPDATLVWQRDLLPFMTRFVVVMAVAFFLFSGFHVYEVTRYIEEDQHQNILAGVQAEISRPPATPLTSTDRNNNALLLLEADTLDKRYHQAGGMLMSRIWARQLTFITGMVLAFVGAVFILGKLTESSSQFSGGTAQMKLAVTSASPGLILSFFGTSLIMASLFVASNLDVADGAAYVNRLQPVAQPQAATVPANLITPPPGLDELRTMESKPNKKPSK